MQKLLKMSFPATPGFPKTTRNRRGTLSAGASCRRHSHSIFPGR
jgi:hypothetical protein